MMPRWWTRAFRAASVNIRCPQRSRGSKLSPMTSSPWSCARDGAALPTWEPGAHIDLALPNGLTRAYSLCGDPADRGRYRIAVLRERAGGGSEYVHGSLAVGDSVEVRGPRNNFVLEDAPAYRFVAGGIGITAILPMIVAAEHRRAEWSFLGLARTGRQAFRDALASLPGDRVRLIDTDVQGRPGIDVVTGPDDGQALLYACGPRGLLNGIADSGWPAERVRFERFQADQEMLDAPKHEFVVHLAKSGLTLEVPEDKSILDVVEEAGIPWPNSCREGTCGTCETAVLFGVVDHRDAILTEAERDMNDYAMICVSRALSSRLELEI